MYVSGKRKGVLQVKWVCMLVGNIPLDFCSALRTYSAPDRRGWAVPKERKEEGNICQSVYASVEYFSLRKRRVFIH